MVPRAKDLEAAILDKSWVRGGGHPSSLQPSVELKPANSKTHECKVATRSIESIQNLFQGVSMAALAFQSLLTETL